MESIDGLIVSEKGEPCARCWTVCDVLWIVAGERVCCGCSMDAVEREE